MIPEIKINYKLIEANDTHFLAPHECSVSVRCEINLGKVDLLLGDIYDLDLCKKKKVKDGRSAQDQLIKIYGDRFVTGNHSLLVNNLLVVLILPNGRRILATHGDYVFYDKEKADNYRRKEAGSNFFRRSAAKVLDKWRMNYRDPKIKAKTMDRAIDLMIKYNCKDMICGHSHRSELGTMFDGEYVLNVLPKGLNHIEFEESGLILDIKTFR